MPNTVFAGDDIKLFLYHTTYTSSTWKELVCATNLELALGFNEITADSKCGKTLLPGSKDFQINFGFFALDAAATTGTISARELIPGILAKATWSVVIADAYSGATKFRVSGSGSIISNNYKLDSGAAVTGDCTLSLNAATVTWDL